ncbi:substrate-binding domain-containing protein [Alkaliphilus hydrothermalis]|uniref:Tungstate transport system substrate-binding protein n=1 Tax=Alkaliphilus hydrothermalis TaxID=1482730 RepID=A0ABS2NSM8_9FIRM|nr:substrate-binding domain-containing protein [Alkaliphilus hydrothermalis]MBM7615867.1 tungstate transport system substrate-binding protein [Alkaliphilus hydrothermalis]
MFKFKITKVLFFMICLLFFATNFTGCIYFSVEQSSESSHSIDASSEAPSTPQESSIIILSTTTSTENSGLLDAILPIFRTDTGIEVKVVAVGTGQALKMGEDGEADVLLVHAQSSEEQFVANGHGVERYDVMYNDFILVGPKDDAAALSTEASADILKAFTLIRQKECKFISRGDDSGTHKTELKLWKEVGLEAGGAWYVEAGQGMGAVLQMASEMQGYTLTDRATYLSMKDDLDLKIVVEGDSKLFNQYGVIAVNPEKNDKINNEGAEKFIDWILSEKGQSLIGEFGKDTYGQSLFIPNAK